MLQQKKYELFQLEKEEDGKRKFEICESKPDVTLVMICDSVQEEKSKVVNTVVYAA